MIGRSIVEGELLAKIVDALLMHGEDAVVVTKAAAGLSDHRIIYVNPAFTRMSGYAADEIVGLDPDRLQGAAGEHGSRRLLHAAAASNQAVQGEVLNHTKHGRPYWCRTKVIPLDVEVSRAGTYLRIERLMTEQERAGSLTQRASDMARQLHEVSTVQYRTLSEAFGRFLAVGSEFLGLPIGLICRVEGDDHIVLAQRGAPKAFGPGSRRRLAETLSYEVVLQGRTIGCEDLGNHETLRSRPARRALMLEAFLATPIWVDGKVYGTLVFSSRAVQRIPFGRLHREFLEMLARSLGHLITARQNEERLEAARAVAEAARDSKAMFLATMSHELRTPLNAIIGFSELIKDLAFGSNVSRYAEYASDIYDSGQHLLSLINDILEMSRIEAAKYTLTPEPLNLDDLVRQCLRLVRLKAREANIELIDFIPDAVPPIEADRRAIRQVLLNLLSNALKYTEPGGSVSVKVEWSDRNLWVAVEDTGIGIAAKHLARLGEPFERVENHLSRRGGGTGLGLALSKSLVQLHGGELQIVSQPGIGTLVIVRLPRNRDEEAGRSSAAE